MAVDAPLCKMMFIPLPFLTLSSPLHLPTAGKASRVVVHHGAPGSAEPTGKSWVLVEAPVAGSGQQGECRLCVLVERCLVVMGAVLCVKDNCRAGWGAV